MKPFQRSINNINDNKESISVNKNMKNKLKTENNDFYCISGSLSSSPLLLPGRHVMNGSMMAANVGAMGYFLSNNDPTIGLAMLGSTTALSSVMGVTLTMAIGGIIIIIVFIGKLWTVKSRLITLHLLYIYMVEGY